MGGEAADVLIPVALQRVIAEVARDAGPNAYNRTYHRHNRS